MVFALLLLFSLVTLGKTATRGVQKAGLTPRLGVRVLAPSAVFVPWGGGRCFISPSFGSGDQLRAAGSGW